MRKIYEFLQRSVILVLLYGSIYFVIESIFKGHPSDYRMAVLGGLLGLWIGIINNAFSYETDLILQGIIGVISVTLTEAIFGYQWNIIEQLGIWDYSSLRFNAVAGQVCLEFSVLAWFPLTILCIMVDDWFDYYVLKKEPCPYYKINGKTIFKFKERKGSSNSYRP